MVTSTVLIPSMDGHASGFPLKYAGDYIRLRTDFSLGKDKTPTSTYNHDDSEYSDFKDQLHLMNVESF